MNYTAEFDQPGKFLPWCCSQGKLISATNTASLRNMATVVLFPIVLCSLSPQKPLKMHSSWILKKKKVKLLTDAGFIACLWSSEARRLLGRHTMACKTVQGAIASEPLCHLCLCSRTSRSVFFSHLWLLYNQSRLPVCGRACQSSDQLLASPFVVWHAPPL